MPAADVVDEHCEWSGRRRQQVSRKSTTTSAEAVALLRSNPDVGAVPTSRA
jgi:hypothetical protein